MRLSHPLRLGLATLAVIAALGAASALPAMADTGSSPSPSPSAGTSPTSSPSPAARVGGCSGTQATILACIKQRSATAISNRETRLQQLTADVNDSADITAGDKSTLLGQLQSDETGLDSLNTTIQNDTSVKQAWEDAQTIVTGYRVYLLETPKVHLVIAANTEATVESEISSVMPALQIAINDSTASAAGKQRAQTAFNDCASRLAAAQSASSGVVSEVIDLLPSGYPGNQPTLVSARQSVVTARQDLGTCRTDINTIRSALGI
ncbi:MAG: hypothetical protein WB802_10225 [Candidatus Dormiibacterota bacterium]|jgi:hypothetical protein